MKKIALVFASIVLIVGMCTISSCTKTNSTPPTVTLVGNATMTSSLNATFTDPGATAKDSKGTVITSIDVTVVPAFNKDLVGDYVYTYSATDADGNKGTATRTVTVRNDAYNYTGVYNNVQNVVTGDGVAAGTYQYNATLTPSSTQNNKVAITNFSGLGTPVVVNVTITNSAVSIATPYIFTGVQVGYEGSVTSANGTVLATIPNFTLTYRVDWNDGTYNNNVDTFTK